MGQIITTLHFTTIATQFFDEIEICIMYITRRVFFELYTMMLILCVSVKYNLINLIIFNYCMSKLCSIRTLQLLHLTYHTCKRQIAAKLVVQWSLQVLHVRDVN